LEPGRSTNQQFVMSTFQGVIQRLKDQEQELERLRRLEKERADWSQRLSENITRQMPTGLITVNRGGIVTSSNPAAKEILRLKVLENRHYSQILASSEAFAGMIENCLKQGQRYHRAEMEVQLIAGPRKNLGISVSPIESAKQEISGAVCLISDLTELVALQKQMRLRESLALVGEMSVGIAHEFKNSLGAIHLYAQLLQNDQSLAEELRSNLRLIAREASQLSSTFNEFLNFARPEELNRGRLDLMELIREALEEFTLDPRFKHVHFEGKGESGPYFGDRVLLKRVLQNLLLNAAESIPPETPGGTVTLTCRTALPADPSTLELEIVDNGCGIPPDQLEKIFLPFFSAKHSGTGLGLAIVQKIILLHDGRIEVTSTPGVGTCFKITLREKSAS
jgi:PAS domain S-box-containing protein